MTGFRPELVNSVGKAIADLYPKPNRMVPGQNYVSSPVRRDRDDRFDVRVDHAITAKSSLIARYSFADSDLYEPFLRENLCEHSGVWGAAPAPGNF